MTKQIEKPETLVDVYGPKAPDAAKFGIGTRTERGAQEAQDARWNAASGESLRKRLNDQITRDTVGPRG